MAAYLGQGKKKLTDELQEKKPSQICVFFPRKSVGHIHLMIPKRPGRKMNWHERRVWVLVQVN